MRFCNTIIGLMDIVWVCLATVVEGIYRHNGPFGWFLSFCWAVQISYFIWRGSWERP